MQPQNQNLRKITSKFGRLAEDYAAEFLLKKGYKIIERNFYSRFGEIDIIALKENVLVYVEVKARWSTKFGAPEESVTPQKIWKIKKTADYYRLTHTNLPLQEQIEVVALEMNGGSVTSIKIISVD